MFERLKRMLRKTPMRIRVWRFLKRIGANLGSNRTALLSGGVAFYAFLSVFPGLAFALIVWSLLTDGESLTVSLGAIRDLVPGDAFTLISDQMTRIATARGGGLSISAFVTLILTLWSSSRAVNALMIAMSVSFHEDEGRGFIRQNLMAIAFTIAAIVFALVSLAAISAVPPILDAIRLGALAETLIRIVRWLVIGGLAFLGILTFYRFARQSRTSARALPGAIGATVIWLAASIAFSFYLAEFDAYNATFGSLGAVAALLMWFWISAFAICIGAEANALLADEDAPT